MSKSILGLWATCLLLASSGFAKLPEHTPLVADHLQSAEGVQIVWNYSLFSMPPSPGCTSCNSFRYASPLYLKLQNLPDGLPETSEATAVLILKHQPWGEAEKVLTATLKKSEGWSAGFPYLPVSESGVQGDSLYTLEIAILLNGKWLTDPISNSHNFSFQLDWQK